MIYLQFKQTNDIITIIYEKQLDGAAAETKSENKKTIYLKTINIVKYMKKSLNGALLSLMLQKLHINTRKTISPKGQTRRLLAS